MWAKIYTIGKNRKGFALMYVMVITLIVFITFAMFAHFVNPYGMRKGNAQLSARVEASADSVIEHILMQINAFPDELDSVPILNPDNPNEKGVSSISKYYQLNPSADQDTIKKTVVAYGIDYLLLKLNGGLDNLETDFTGEDPHDYLQLDYTSYDKTKVNEGTGSLWDAEDNIAIYLYDLKDNTLYALGNSDGIIKDYSQADIWNKEFPPAYYVADNSLIDVENNIVKSISLKQFDPSFLTDNRWIEINANTQYTDDGGDFPSTKFAIRTSAKLITESNKNSIVRNLYAEATLQSIDVKVNSHSGSSTNGQVPSAFKYSIYSGQGFIANGYTRFNEGDIQSDGSYKIDNNGGDVYVDGDTILNGNILINGYLATSQGEGSVMRNGFVKIKKGIQYNKNESLPEFGQDEEDNVKTASIVSSSHTAKGFNGSISTNGWNEDLEVDGIQCSHYVDGRVDVNGNADVNIYPAVQNGEETKYGWYINGDLCFNGENTINFIEPVIVWVNGDVIFNGKTQINGSGTIVADGQIIFNGFGGTHYSTNEDLIAFISLGKEMPSAGEKWGGIIVNGFGKYEGIFYAPHSDIVFNGDAKVFGAVVGGGQENISNGVVLNGRGEFTFDKRLASGQDVVIPPLPSSQSNSVSGWKVYRPLDKYRLTWKEIIGEEVAPANIYNLTPEFNYQPSSTT